MNHLNQDYDGGSPNIPLNIGDRFYSQDLCRDFWYMLNKVGESIKNAYTAFPILFTTPVISQGASFHEINITGVSGLCNYQVRVPLSFATLPPSSQLEDIAVQVNMSSQANIDFQSTATLDGATTNYVKLQYAEADGPTRARAKKAGSYPYEKIPSFLLVIDSNPGTDYDIVLGTLIGDDSTFLTIVSFNATDLKGASTNLITVTAKENITAGDPVSFDSIVNPGEAEKIFRGMLFSTDVTYDPTFSVSSYKVSTIGTTNKFVVAFGLNSGVATDGAYVRVGHINSINAIVWDTAAIAASSVFPNNGPNSIQVMEYGSDQFVVAWADSSNNGYLSLGRWNGATVVWDIFEYGYGIVNSQIYMLPDYLQTGDFVLAYLNSVGRIDMDVLYVSGSSFATRPGSPFSDVLGFSLSEFYMCYGKDKQEVLFTGGNSNIVYARYLNLVGTTIAALTPVVSIESATSFVYGAYEIGENISQNALLVIRTSESTVRFIYIHRENASIKRDTFNAAGNDAQLLRGSATGGPLGDLRSPNLLFQYGNVMMYLKLTANDANHSVKNFLFRRNKESITQFSSFCHYGDDYIITVGPSVLNVFKYAEFAGIANSSALAGAPVDIAMVGRLGGLSNLTPGKNYYVDYEAQKITKQLTSTKLGRAISSTELELGI